MITKYASSGSNVDVAILTKTKVEVKRNFRVYNKKIYEKQIPYNFPRNNTRRDCPI
jgi:20S proteasome subunit beta 2